MTQIAQKGFNPKGFFFHSMTVNSEAHSTKVFSARYITIFKP